MPVGRFWGRLKRHNERAEHEERKRRHELYTFFSAMFFAGRGESDPPTTREEYENQKKKKPKEPTPEDWRNAEQARKQWERIREMYFKGASSPYHFEDIMGFGGHLFDEPEEPERKVMTAEDWREMERQAEAEFMARARAQLSMSKNGS